MPVAFNDYRAFDALGLAQAIKRGELSRRDVLDAALARIAEVNPSINAVSYLHPAAEVEALADAGAPFAGVPYLIKDLHAPVAGMPLAHGSRFFAGQNSDFDSETVARLRRAPHLVLAGGCRLLSEAKRRQLGAGGCNRKFRRACSRPDPAELHRRRSYCRRHSCRSRMKPCLHRLQTMRCR